MLDLGKQLRTIINDARRGFSWDTVDLGIGPFVPEVQHSLKERGNKVLSEGQNRMKINHAQESEREIAGSDSRDACRAQNLLKMWKGGEAMTD